MTGIRPNFLLSLVLENTYDDDDDVTVMVMALLIDGDKILQYEAVVGRLL